MEPDWISGFDLARGASLLIHDCQYADREYPDHVGWGHSAVSHTLDFVKRTEPEHTLLFHHDPLHSDDYLDALYDGVAGQWRALGGDPAAIEMATERCELQVGSAPAAPPAATS